MRRVFSAMCVSGVLAFAVPALAPIAAQTDKATTTAKQAGSKTKDAAKDAGTAAKDAGKAAKEAVLPADAPKDATGQCTDGTYTTAKTRKGACAGHGGVKMFATAQCNDGTYSFAKSTKGACSNHGGVKAAL
jgi:uncharacterized protein DUF3761